MTRLMGEILTAVGMIAAAVWVMVVALEFPAGGHIMPAFCALGVIGLSLCVVGEAIWKKRDQLKEKIHFEWDYIRIKPYILFIITLIYFGTIFKLGYYFSTILFLVIASYFIGVRRYKFIFMTALILLPAMYAFFELFLQARLPTGWLI